MGSAHIAHKLNCISLARRASNALLLLAIAGLLNACGGGASEPGSGGGGTVVGGGTCVTGTTTTQLTWDPVIGATGYRVYVGAAPGTYFQQFGQGNDVGPVTTAPVPGLSPTTTYYFAVTAYDGAGNESSYSSEVCKVTT